MDSWARERAESTIQHRREGSGASGRWKTKWSSYLGPAARIAASDVRAATRATVAASAGTPMNLAILAISRSGCSRNVS